MWHPSTKRHGSILLWSRPMPDAAAWWAASYPRVVVPGMKCAVSWCAGRFDVRAHRTFLKPSSWSWWRQPHHLALALPSTDRTDQTEGDAVSRAGSSRFDDVASFVSSCKSTCIWQDNSCQNSQKCPRRPLLQALQFSPCRLSSCEQVRNSSEESPFFTPSQDCTRSVLGWHWNA